MTRRAAQFPARRARWRSPRPQKICHGEASERLASLRAAAHPAPGYKRIQANGYRRKIQIQRRPGSSGWDRVGGFCQRRSGQRFLLRLGWGLFKNRPAQDYHSDSAISTRKTNKNPLPRDPPRPTRVFPPDGPTLDVKGLHRPRQGAKRMAKMESQRERKARKKNIARSQQVLDQVQLFRCGLRDC